jgi:asparagine synthase (glutamine-hydrolysing)
MCGIIYGKNVPIDVCIKMLNNIKNRGPTNTSIFYNDEIFVGFNRLAIQGDNWSDSQPFIKNNIILVCNGEIYNYKELKKKYKIEMKTNSDCEILIHLYILLGFEKMLKEICGEYAIIIHDDDKVYFSRDKFGVRPLFYHISDCIMIGSERKSIAYDSDQVEPNYSYEYNIKEKKLIQHEREQLMNIKYDNINNENDILNGIRYYLFRAVAKRLQCSENLEVGCLLSGGLDSSIICSIASLLINYNMSYEQLTIERINYMMENQIREIPIKCFTISMGEGTDLEYAKKLAYFIKGEHIVNEISQEDMLKEIPNVVYHTETYDTTTIRASTPNYIIAKKASEKVKILLTGEGADELAGGYLYFHNAPSDSDFDNECKRLLKNIHYYDVLRCDRSISSNGMEARVPFLDDEFVDFYLSIPDFYRNRKPEKHILREAFKKILPVSIYMRQKEAFSDGVSSTKKSWYQIIRDYIRDKIDPIILSNIIHEYNLDNIEQAYYLYLYLQHYDQLWLTEYWKPKWSNTTEPSARMLNVYNQI